MISVPYLKECVEYDANTGLFTWKERPVSHFKHGKYGSQSVCDAWNKAYSGRPAFQNSDNRGYLSGAILGKHYSAHRSAFAIGNGGWPMWTVDHINGNRIDNRLCNLREATPAQQIMNSAKGNKAVRGVAMHKRANGGIKFSASIRVHLGYFATEEEAAAAYEKAAKDVHDREFYLQNGVRVI